MELCYETERLFLRILREDAAEQVLSFYLENKEIFELWEPDRPQNFYTKAYQSALLNCEFQMTAKMSGLRFWVFLKEQPEKIIGTISFQNILRSIYQSCQIGYKFSSCYWHQGYACESINKSLSILKTEFHLHRVEALVLPSNAPSIRLLERLGFQNEGICRSCVYLHSHWTDHLRYSFIHP